MYSRKWWSFEIGDFITIVNRVFVHEREREGEEYLKKETIERRNETGRILALDPPRSVGCFSNWMARSRKRCRPDRISRWPFRATGRKRTKWQKFVSRARSVKGKKRLENMSRCDLSFDPPPLCFHFEGLPNLFPCLHRFPFSFFVSLFRFFSFLFSFFVFRLTEREKEREKRQSFAFVA